MTTHGVSLNYFLHFDGVLHSIQSERRKPLPNKMA